MTSKPTPAALPSLRALLDRRKRASQINDMSAAVCDYLRTLISNDAHQSVRRCAAAQQSLSNFFSLGHVYVTSWAGARPRRALESLVVGPSPPAPREPQRWIRLVLSVVDCEAHARPPADVSTVTISLSPGEASTTTSASPGSADPSVMMEHDPSHKGTRLILVMQPVVLPHYVCRSASERDLQSGEVVDQAAEAALQRRLEDLVVEHEAQWMHDAAVVLAELEEHYCSSPPPSGRVPDGDDEVHMPQTLQLAVPVYFLWARASDNADTRLADLGPFTHRVMDVGVDSSVSLVHNSTVVLQGLFSLAEVIPRSPDVHQLWRQALSALHLFVRGLAAAPDGVEQPHVARARVQEALSSLREKAARPLHTSVQPPAVLVHCHQGVSRSPSLVLFYFIYKLRPVWTVLMQQASFVQEDRALEEGEPPLLLSFAALLRAAQTARPDIKPNLCFAAELCAIWRQLTAM